MNIRPFPARDYSIDNIRFILIFFVVLAHFLEICTPFKGSSLIYNFIYSFHMPLFIFLFGYNVKYLQKKIIYRWCLPYIIFQCAYLTALKVLKADANYQFTTPYWHLWYMLVCIYYQQLVPLFDTDNKHNQTIIILFGFIISLLIGYEKSVGYYMSLSRFFVFLPWFLLGYYCKKNKHIERCSLQPKRRFFVLFASAAMITILIPFVRTMPHGLLHGSYSYSSCSGTLLMRVITSVMSFSMILFLCVGMRPYLNRKILFITNIGQNTWPIFLLHGFVIKAIPVCFPSLTNSPWRVILLTCAVVILLGNKFCNNAIYYACFSWLEKYSTKTTDTETVR